MLRLATHQSMQDFGVHPKITGLSAWTGQAFHIGIPKILWPLRSLAFLPRHSQPYIYPAYATSMSHGESRGKHVLF